MQSKQRDVFATVHTEGALLPADLLRRVADGDRSVAGLRAQDYHLVPGEKLNEAISRSWNRLQGVWAAFLDAHAKLPATDTGTTLTRDRWLFPLFQELGYGRLTTARAVEIEGRSYAISHAWGHVPIHLVSYRLKLHRQAAGVAGASRSNPHSLLQELLNRSDEYLWGFVSNGLRLRILRDNTSLTRQAYVEFDLEAMMQGELYADFVLLWLLCHVSRVEGERPEECWLEKWSRMAQEQGTRALDTLRDGMQRAIEALGSGFLRHPTNRQLRDRLTEGALDAQDYYRQLLRLVYRLLFLFVAEDRELLFAPGASSEARERYSRFYSTRRLRVLAQRRRGTRHADLYHALRLVMRVLGDAAGCAALGLPPLGSFLFAAGGNGAVPDLEQCEIGNGDLLSAVRELAYTVDGNVLRPVDYRNLGAEEFGSVYEALLELHPRMHVETAGFSLGTASGNERKSTGSYYTPSNLITVLLDSALDPVLDEAARKPDPASAILDLKICDPACGSGHFLIAAAHRVARKLAGVETGEEEPAPEAMRSALRRVIGRCIYGVDLNPMAVELCKVSLWIEALEPGKPLSFLDHHIQIGNSLLGSTPALLRNGIPDAAFEPIEGDDRAYAIIWKRRNKEERTKQQMAFFDYDLQPWGQLGSLAAEMQRLDDIDDTTTAGVHAKQQRWEEMARSITYLHPTFLADAWCAAFVWKKTDEWNYPITENVFRELEKSPLRATASMKAEVHRLAEQYLFFHWHLRFPNVFQAPGKGKQPDNRRAGWVGGFDVVLGNPPWERIKLQEKEWFATRCPDIANASNAAARKRRIDALKTEDPLLYAAWKDALRRAEGESHLVRRSGLYPLTGRGDINTFAIFAEANRLILNSTGRVGCIVPSGIATDDTTKFFFQDLAETQSLVSLFSFENEELIFPAVHHFTKFCLLTMSGSDRPQKSADFVFFARQTKHLQDKYRHFTLTAADLALLNPNTRTCPIFRSQRDAELTKEIFRRVPVLIKEGTPEQNPWGIQFLAMFHMSGDSELFNTREYMVQQGLTLEGNNFRQHEDVYLPLYEAKMVHQFDHRFGSYKGQTEAQANQGKLPELTDKQHSDPEHVAFPRYWVPSRAVEKRLADKWNRLWLLGWRDVTNMTNRRTVIASIIPRTGVGDKYLLMLPSQHAHKIAALLCNLNSFIFDYIARQKIGGMSLKYFVIKQLASLPPETYAHSVAWSSPYALNDWILARGLELTYTAWDLASFARDCGYDGAPFRWDEERRFLLRCELDAGYFHLYSIARTDVDYIMETFPIVKRKDVEKYGEYRTKRVILEIYDAMLRATESGELYQTLLDPPPADPREAFPPREGGKTPVGPPIPIISPLVAEASYQTVGSSANEESRSALGGTTTEDTTHASRAKTTFQRASEPSGVETRKATPINVSPSSSPQAEGYTQTTKDGNSTVPLFEGLPAAAAKPKEVFQTGERVRHHSFGDGQIMAVQGSGDNALLTVVFKEAGKKTLMAGMAQLQRLP